jgi:hypothetical protein
VPSKFPQAGVTSDKQENLPKTTASGRRSMEQMRYLKMESQMFAFDSINSFADLQTKWEKVHLPKGVIVQILEEEKICLTSLLRRFAKMRFQSIQDPFQESDTEMKQEVLLKAYILADLIQVKEPKDETEGETNIIYYIVGYVAKALTKAKCISCTSKLVASDESHGMELDHMEMGDGDKSVFFIFEAERWTL